MIYFRNKATDQVSDDRVRQKSKYVEIEILRQHDQLSIGCRVIIPTERSIIFKIINCIQRQKM